MDFLADLLAFLAFLALVLLSLGVYFLPHIVAEKRKCKHIAGIFVINLFLGWTLLGWVICLAWACANEPKPSTD